MNISSRIKNISVSSVRKLVKFEKNAIDRGVEIIHLNIGQPDLNVPKYFKNGIFESDCTFLGYAASQGMPTLIKEIIKYYKRIGGNFNSDEVHITAGGSEALLFAMIATCNIGDEIIIPEPYYSNYNTIADMAGVILVPIQTKIDNGFHLPDYKAIELLINDKTKAILLSNPNNPTGTVLTTDEFNLVIKLSLDNKLWIIADEVYREFVFDGKKYRTFATYENNKNIIIIDSVSKRFSACGCRVGTLITKNAELNQQFDKLCQSRLSVSVMDQLGAASLYKNLNDSYIDKVKNEYQRRRDTLLNELSSIENVKLYVPEGAFYVIVRLPIDDCDLFCKWLLTDFSLDNTTIMLTPAKGFYKDEMRGRFEVRIAFVVEEEVLIKAALILKTALNEYRRLINL